MIDFYTAGTGNGHRAAIALEESGLAYRAHKLNLAAGDARKPEYLAINSAAMIPAIVDQDGPGGKPLTIAQSGAIVLYLAEKSGKLLRRTRCAGRRRCIGSCTPAPIAR
jgi:GST-like protein